MLSTWMGGHYPGQAATWAAIIADMAIKGLALTAIAFAAGAALRRSSAAVRHALWAASLWAMGLLPVLSAVLPTVAVPVLPAVETRAPDGGEAVGGAEATPATDARSVESEGGQVGGGPREALSAGGAAGARPGGAQMTKPGGVARDAREDGGVSSRGWRGYVAGFFGRHWAAAVVGVWAAGAILAALPVLISAIGLRRMRRKLERVNRTAAGGTAEEATKGTRRRVRFLTLEEGEIPITWGWRKPVIAMPAQARDWPDDKRRAVMLHELAHVERGDFVTQAVSRIACAIHWFNPLAWMAYERLIIEREAACDDRVVREGARPSEYARHLLEVAHAARQRKGATAMAIAIARSPRIEGRIRRILDSGCDRAGISARGVLAMAVLALAILAPLAGLQATAKGQGDWKQLPRARMEAGAASESAATANAAAETTGPAKTQAAKMVLKHDRDQEDGRLSMSGSGHFVRFETPKGKWYLTQVQIFGGRYGTADPPDEDWLITLCDENFKTVKHLKRPYSIFERGDMRWYGVDVPPLELPSGTGFWINVYFNPHQTKGVYVGYDKSTGGEFSFAGLPDRTEQAKKEYDWMIRLAIAQEPPADAEMGAWIGAPLEIRNDDGAANGQRSIAGAGPAVRFENTVEGAQLVGFSIYGSMYGRDFDAKNTFAEYWILDESGAVISGGKFPYSIFGYNPAWVDLEITPMDAPKVFSLLVNPHAQKNRGIYFRYDSDTQSGHSRTGGEPGAINEGACEWEWMIRAYLSEPEKSGK